MTISSKTEAYQFPEIKPYQMQTHCQILATATHLPETVVSTEEIIEKQQFTLSAKVVTETIGPSNRRVAPEGQADSDLLVQASRKCLKKAGIENSQLSKIIVTKLIGDRLLPMTASLLQSQLGCPQAVQSYDIDGGINSFLQAFDLASRLINMGDEYILIASGGINTPFITTSDPRSAFLFGDGAAAILLGPSEKQTILSSYSFTNHAFFHMTQGLANTEELRHSNLSNPTQQQLAYNLYHRENELPAHDFIVEALKVTKEKLLTSAAISEDEIDLYLITENSKRIWERCQKALGIPQDKTISLIDELGNTMSAMLPMQLNRAITTEKIQAGSTCMLLSIGEGINAGGMIYRVNE